MLGCYIISGPFRGQPEDRGEVCGSAYCGETGLTHDPNRHRLFGSV